MENTKNIACFIDTRTRWKKFLDRLFPHNYLELEDDLFIGTTDIIRHSVNVYVDWKDRIRILISGKIRVDSTIFTEHKVGETKSKAVLSVPLSF